MAATYTPIATYTVTGSAVSSYTFSSIPTTYTDLVLIGNIIRTTGADIYMQVGNGSVDTTASNYSGTYVYGNGTSAGSGRWTSANNLFWDIGYSSSTDPSISVVHLNNYSNTSTFKTMLVRNSAAAADTSAWAELWRSTSAINTIKVYPTAGNFNVGTTFTLYGILAA